MKIITNGKFIYLQNIYIEKFFENIYKGKFNTNNLHNKILLKIFTNEKYV